MPLPGRNVRRAPSSARGQDSTVTTETAENTPTDTIVYNANHLLTVQSFLLFSKVVCWD